MRVSLFKVTIFITFVAFFLWFNLVHKSSDTKITQKSIVYICQKKPEQWDDLLKGIFSAFIFARLAERRFQIGIDDTCPFQRYFAPKNEIWFSFKLSDECLKKDTVYFDEIDNENFPNVIRDIDILNEYRDEDMIVTRSTMDWLHFMSQNPYLKEKVEHLGSNLSQFTLSHLFKTIYNHFFDLAPTLVPTYVHFLLRKKSSKLLCVEIKSEFGVRDTYLFWDTTKNTFGIDENDKEYQIFIVMDKKRLLFEKAVELFGHERVLSIEDGNIDTMQKKLLEFHVMQHCDGVILDRSGFGKLSVLLRKKPDEKLFILENQHAQPILKQINAEYLISQV